MKVRGTMKGDHGTASFALLGILLISMSIVAVSYVAYVENQSYENRLQTDKITDMERSGEKTLESIKTKLHIIAIESALEANRVSVLESVSEIFNIGVQEFFKETVENDGWRRGKHHVLLSVNSSSVFMDVKTAEVDVITQGNEGASDLLQTDIPGVHGRDNRSFYYGVHGVIALSIEDRDYDLTLNRSENIDITVDIPYPFLDRKMDALESSLYGTESQVARVTRYIITTVAQYRALMGYGIMEYESSEDTYSDATEDIITLEDVEIALNLAILLEMAYQYRTYDPVALESLINNTASYGYKIDQIVETYIANGRICPGDLIALFFRYAYDGDVISEDEAKPIDLQSIISQALYAIFDQFLLKYTEYFGISTLVDYMFRGVQIISDVLDRAKGAGQSVWSWITGGDEEEINPKQVRMVSDWIQDVFMAAGIPGTYIVNDIYYPYNSIDGQVIHGYPRVSDEFGESYDITIRIRLTGHEHTHYEYTCGHHAVNYDNDTCPKKIFFDHGDYYVRCGAERTIVGYDYTEYTYRVCVNGGSPIQFRPVDILRGNDEIWQEFYNQHYTDEDNPDIKTIREGVQAVITRVVRHISESSTIQDIIRRYNKVEINVNDRRSLFDDINRAVDSAVTETFAYFRDDPKVIGDVVMNTLYDKENPEIESLKDILKNRYHELYTDYYKQNTALFTAEALISEVSDFRTIELLDTVVVPGGVNDRCDMHAETITEPQAQDIEHIMIYGGTKSDSILFSMADSLSGEVSSALDIIKSREVDEVDHGKRHSDKDGLLIQALDFYAYDTTISPSETLDTRTRGSRHPPDSVRIHSITPDPATIGQDTIRFIGSADINFTHLEWTSDLDGHLSNKLDYNISASFMSAGQHVITLTVTDSSGFIHRDHGDLLINRPPVAAIDEVIPSPVTQGEEVFFTESSYDIDGELVSYLWEFGDGHDSTIRQPVHTYETPGTYTIRLTVWDDHGGTDTAHTHILVDDRPYVTYISPDDPDGWDTDQMITVYFSEEVDPDSFEYDIVPEMEFTVSWKENNSAVQLEPNSHYRRFTDYELIITHVVDIDNGVHSSLEGPVSHTWKTREYARLTDYQPSEDDVVKLQRSIVLEFDEAVMLTSGLDVSMLVSGDWGWTYRLEGDGRVIILDHDRFTPGTRITLQIDLSVLNTISDGSIVTTDGLGNVDLEISFVTEENLSPMLISTYPSNGMKNVSTSGMIFLNFSQPMDVGTFNLTITPLPEHIYYTWDDENRSVIINYEGLMYGIRYTVFIDIFSKEGVALQTPVDSYEYTNPLSFFTKDDLPPEVINILPWDGQTRFLSDAPIVITFNKRVCPDSLEFTVSPDPGGWVEEWDSSHTYLHLYHDDFQRDTWYTFTLEGVEDTRGNSMEGSLEITFHTSLNGDEIQGSRFQRMIWSIVGGGAMRFSLFCLAETMIKSTTKNMVTASEISNLEVRLPLNTFEEFSYTEYGYNSIKELELSVDYHPGYIHLEDENIISEPTGLHYTDIWTFTSRPFETYWNISIPDIEVSFNVSTTTGMVLSHGGSQGAFINRTLSVGFDILVVVSSGWGLAGVDYSISSDFFSDIVDFLGHIWDRIVDFVLYILNAIRKMIDTLSDLVGAIKDHAQDLLEYIGEMIQHTVRDLIAPLIDNVVSLLHTLIGSRFNMGFLLSGLGLGVSMDPDGKPSDIPMYDGEVDVYMKLSMGTSMRGTSFSAELNLLCDTIIAFGSISIGGLEMDWQMDPTYDPLFDTGNIYPAWFQGQGRAGEEGSGALLNLTVPVIKEPTDELTLALSDLVPINTVTIPIGPVVVSDIDLGANMIVMDMEESKYSLVSGVIINTFRDTASSISGTIHTIDHIIQFIVTLVQRFVDEIISLITNFIQELYLFFKATISGIRICLTFGFNGSDTVIEFFQWICSAVRTMIENVGKMRLSAPETGLSSCIMQETWLGITISDAAGGVKGFFKTNLPAITSVLGIDAGTSKIYFGIELPGDFLLIKGELVEW